MAASRDYQAGYRQATDHVAAGAAVTAYAEPANDYQRGWNAGHAQEERNQADRQAWRHACLSGPLCAYWYARHSHHEDPGGCIHDSCMAITHGDCQACDREAEAAERAGLVWCTRHGYTPVTDSGQSTGFAGGAVYWANLACGCADMDESADVRAAR